MRNILNISLPEEMVKLIKSEVKTGKFASTSEFMRHLIRMWNTEKLAQDVEQSRAEIVAGKGKVLRSLKDLRS
jgi:putative addiction module CopG family antidote